MARFQSKEAWREAKALSSWTKKLSQTCLNFYEKEVKQSRDPKAVYQIYNKKLTTHLKQTSSDFTHAHVMQITKAIQSFAQAEAPPQIALAAK